MKVVKRDGKTVPYDRQKIIVAISKANAEVDEKDRIDDEQIKKIIKRIESTKKERLLIEDIQDKIEEGLVNFNKYELSKAYMLYRYKRALARKANTTDESILSLIKNSNKELAEENSNKSTTLASTQRDYIAGEVSRD